MNTDHNSLENMLDNETEARPVERQEAPPAPTGETSAAPPADAPVHQTRDDEGHLVPRKALEDERKKRQELERKFAEFGQQPAWQPEQQQMPQLPAEAPDPFFDPQGFAQWVTISAASQAEARADFQMLNREAHRSERRARKAHGDDAVEKALAAAEKAGIAHQFIRAEDPYDEMVKWHSDYQIASDPASHRERLRAEILAEMGITPQNGQHPAQRQRAPVPKSLATTTSAQPRNDRGQYTGSRPLSDILG